MYPCHVVDIWIHRRSTVDFCFIVHGEDGGLGLADFYLNVPLPCPTDKPILPNVLSAQAELGRQWNV